MEVASSKYAIGLEALTGPYGSVQRQETISWARFMDLTSYRGSVSLWFLSGFAGFTPLERLGLMAHCRTFGKKMMSSHVFQCHSAIPKASPRHFLSTSPDPHRANRTCRPQVGLIYEVWGNHQAISSWWAEETNDVQWCLGEHPILAFCERLRDLCYEYRNF